MNFEWTTASTAILALVFYLLLLTIAFTRNEAPHFSLIVLFIPETKISMDAACLKYGGSSLPHFFLKKLMRPFEVNILII